MKPETSGSEATLATSKGFHVYFSPGRTNSFHMLGQNYEIWHQEAPLARHNMKDSSLCWHDRDIIHWPCRQRVGKLFSPRKKPGFLRISLNIKYSKEIKQRSEIKLENLPGRRNERAATPVSSWESFTNIKPSWHETNRNNSPVPRFEVTWPGDSFVATGTDGQRFWLTAACPPSAASVHGGTHTLLTTPPPNWTVWYVTFLHSPPLAAVISGEAADDISEREPAS